MNRPVWIGGLFASWILSLGSRHPVPPLPNSLLCPRGQEARSYLFHSLTARVWDTAQVLPVRCRWGGRRRPRSSCYCFWQASPNRCKCTHVQSPAPCVLAARIPTGVMVRPAAAGLLTSALPALAQVCEPPKSFYSYTVV